ncbi:MAG: hypothetical protein ACRDQ1_06975 [Sciscionella sp.]
MTTAAEDTSTPSTICLVCTEPSNAVVVLAGSVPPESAALNPLILQWETAILPRGLRDRLPVFDGEVTIR